MHTYIFGPVPSRRLGISLGVDLTPTKTCSFDCLYCQLCRTNFHTATRCAFCDPDEVLRELRETLAEIAQPDWITLSGTGEPTLHSGLGYLLAEIKKLNNAPTCVITNSSLLHLPEVRNELLLADRLLPTLTTVNKYTFKRIHRPTEDLDLESILNGLRKFVNEFTGTVEIEVFVCPGINDSDSEIEALGNYLNSLDGLESVYLNTAVRVPLESEIQTADQSCLNRFREHLRLRVPVSTAFEHSLIPPKKSSWSRPALSSDVLKLLLRHPCSQEQLEKVFGSSAENILRLLCELAERGLIKKENNDCWSLINDNQCRSGT
ncbi:MAG TPA: radical SAM protein [Candidatus Rifleibacterium sp.]|nr:radical SAM protein [Candidatus Rifleibacterium sp.]HPT44445.1 radical SAM protein [Candidatus Rifleibacterium sp.]